jgi:hypothetical protein
MPQGVVALPMLKASAAVCSSAVLAGRLRTRWETTLWNKIDKYNVDRMDAMNLVSTSLSFGRLTESRHTPVSYKGMEPSAIDWGAVAIDDWLETTSQTTTSIVGAMNRRIPLLHTFGADSICSSLAATIFPDRIDATLFDAIVPRTFAARISKLIVELKNEVFTLFDTNIYIRSVLISPNVVAAYARKAQIVVTGAARQSPLGRGAPIPRTAVSSTDGATLQGLLQISAMISERLKLVVMAGDPCEHAAFVEPTVANAYYLHPVGCVRISPTLLVPPFADQSYDKQSILAGFGFIVAHELGHMVSHSHMHTATYRTLMAAYPESTRGEGFADVIGALAVLGLLGTTNYTEIVLQQAQVWCAKAPDRFVPEENMTHPAPNRRFVFLCQTIANIPGYSCDWSDR